MNTAADDTVHAQDEAVHDSSTHTQADPTIFSGVGNGPQLLSPANVLVGTLVPRSCLQLWAGIDGEEVQSAGAVFEPLPRNALRISHVRELISELKPKFWKKFYQRAGTTKFVRHTSLFEWLSQLGVPLPPLEAWTKQSFGHFHDNICTALDSKESAIAAACKRMQRVRDALGEQTVRMQRTKTGSCSFHSYLPRSCCCVPCRGSALPCALAQSATRRRLCSRLALLRCRQRTSHPLPQCP